MGALIDMERKGCESIIHDHDCDVWVTMVGWVPGGALPSFVIRGGAAL